ncbi:MAG: hypothetical protein AAGF12_19330 [Myxococcota bacterium]
MRCLVAVLVLAASPAAAQDITVILEDVTGADVADVRANGFSAAQCAANTSLRLQLRSVPTDRNRLVFFRGDDCNLVESRDGDEPASECDRLTIPDITASSADLEVTTDVLSLLVHTMDNTTLTCDNIDASRDIFILAVDDDPNSEDVGTGWGVITLELDTVAPNVPSNIAGGTGNTAIPVGWGELDPDTDEHRIYVDETGCPSTTLIAGESAAGLTPVTTVGGTSTSADINGQELGLQIGDMAAVAVTSRDATDNESVLSDVVCVTRVETEGFCETFGNCETCSVTPGTSRGFGSLGFAMLAAGAALVVRKRRRFRRHR